MSLIKVPIFSGLVTNSDPEDLNLDLSPDTNNFDISRPGILKRRDASTLIEMPQDRGVSNAVLWSNSHLPDLYEWIAYCKQRGIIYRKSVLWQTIPTDSYDSLLANYDTPNAPVVNANQPFSTYLRVLPDPLPNAISFTAVGNLLIVNTGKDHSPYIIYRTKDINNFQNLVTVDDATYIESFHRKYPSTFTCSVATNTNGGTLPNGTYQYNVAPIYDGVNEQPLSGDYVKSVTLASATNQQNVIQIGLDKNEYLRSLSGLAIYRSFQDTGSATPTSFRRTKVINIRGAIGTNDQVVSRTDLRTSAYITYCSNGFPSKAEIIAKWDATYGSGNFANHDKYYKLIETKPKDDILASQRGTYTDSATGIEYYYDTASTTVDSGNNLWQIDIENDYEGRFLDGSTTRRFLSNFVSEAIAGTSPNFYSRRRDGQTMLMRIYSLTTSSVEHFPLHGVYMGTDKIYSPTADMFSLNNNYAGATVNITYTNNSGSAVTCSEEILAHDQRMIQVVTPNAGLSADMEAMSFALTGNGNTSTSVGIAPRTISGSTVNNLSFALSTNAVTVTYKDKGDSVGSLPRVPLGSNTNVSWEHSIPHGGRLFVGNVMLDTEDSREVHEDMICFSEIGMPGVIPIVNYIQIKDPQGGGITGLQSIGDSLIVLMENGTYRLKVPSVDPRTYSVLESHEQIGCVANETITKVEDVIYFCGKGNIYKIDGTFLVSEIGEPILNTYLKIDDKEKSIAEYDPIKEVIVFRLGTTKKDLYEYSIRSGKWNRIQTFGSVSQMSQGIDGELYYFDNASLTITRTDRASLTEDSDDTEVVPGSNTTDESDNVFDSVSVISNAIADIEETWGNNSGALQNGYYFVEPSYFNQSSHQNYIGASKYVAMKIISDTLLRSDGVRVVIGELMILNRTSYDDGSYAWHTMYNKATSSNPQNVENLRSVIVEIPYEQMDELKVPEDEDYIYDVGNFEQWTDPYGSTGSELSKLVIFRANHSEATKPNVVTVDAQSEYGQSFYVRYNDILGMRRWSDIYSSSGLSGESATNGEWYAGQNAYNIPSHATVNADANVVSDGSNIHYPYWSKILTPTIQATELKNLWDITDNANPNIRGGYFIGDVIHVRRTGGINERLRYQVWQVYYPDGNDGGHTSGIWRPMKNSLRAYYQNDLAYVYFYRLIENETTGQTFNAPIQANAYPMAHPNYTAYDPRREYAVHLTQVVIPGNLNVMAYKTSSHDVPYPGYLIEIGS